MSVSTVPLPPAFFHAILRKLAQHPDGIRRRDLHEPVADLMQLSAAQRAERLPSGGRLRYAHRIGWSYNMLKNGGYVESTAPGTWRPTARGLDLLAQHPQGFDETTVRRIVREANAATGDEGEENGAEQPASATLQTPEERIDAATREIQDAVNRDLLERVMTASPALFEEMVLDLIHALGYGTSEEDVQHVGGSGDGGIDGVISLDKLGFEKVCIQAKRWQNTVGRPELQAFFGALAGRRAKKGVFITTSSFTREAREFGERVADGIVLIDGQRLASLMIEHAIGVTHYRIVRIPRVDGDYFDVE
jgi:restriction system protein